ncbi:MAG: arsenite-activated ATPase ArsA [Firmicutes bacterium]|nr:arsenite-activated ATPase ArsA [Bacillota bacterium]
MRVILYTGKGGVGKTSVAAATAVSAAKAGKKTIIVSTDAAHSLGDVLLHDLDNKPQLVMENLWAQEISSLACTEKHWGKVQEYLSMLMVSQKVAEISAEDLMVFPGLEEVFCLIEIFTHCTQGNYEVVIVDCAPTGETLRLLSFPEVMNWWLEKIFPIQRMVLKVARPVVKPVFNVTLPPDSFLEAIAELFRKISAMHNLLTDSAITSVRLVINPEKMVIKEAERSFVYLNLYDFIVDAVIVNRVLPETGLGSYFVNWSASQKAYLTYIENQFSPVPICYVPLFDQEVAGIDLLTKMGEECFGSKDSVSFFSCRKPQRIYHFSEGYIWELTLPVIKAKEDIALSQKGEEITVKIGDYKRNLYMPRILQGRQVLSATFEDTALRIQFGERLSPNNKQC